MTVPGLLSQEDIARIEERAEFIREDASYDLKVRTQALIEDIPALLAHIRAQDAEMDLMRRVCILVGWTAIQPGERGEALTQAWMEWSKRYPRDELGPMRNRELDEQIPALARERRRVVAETLDKVFAARAVQSSENPRDIPREDAQ